MHPAGLMEYKMDSSDGESTPSSSSASSMIGEPPTPPSKVDFETHNFNHRHPATVMAPSNNPRSSYFPAMIMRTPTKVREAETLARSATITSTPRLKRIDREDKLRADFFGTGFLENSPSRRGEPDSPDSSPSVLTSTPRQKFLNPQDKVRTHVFGTDLDAHTPTKKSRFTTKKIYNAGSQLGHSAIVDLKKFGQNLKLPRALTHHNLGGHQRSISTSNSCKDLLPPDPEDESTRGSYDYRCGSYDSGDRRKELQALKEFGSNFILTSPRPDDLVDIIGKYNDEDMYQEYKPQRIAGAKIAHLGGIGHSPVRQSPRRDSPRKESSGRPLDPRELASRQLTQNLTKNGFLSPSMNNLRRTVGGAVQKSRKNAQQNLLAAKAKEFEIAAQIVQRQAYESMARAELLDRQLHENAIAIQARNEAIERINQAMRNLQMIADYQGDDLEALRAQIPQDTPADVDQPVQLTSSFWHRDLDGETIFETDSHYDDSSDAQSWSSGSEFLYPVHFEGALEFLNVTGH